jgi:hypothetical protein
MELLDVGRLLEMLLLDVGRRQRLETLLLEMLLLDVLFLDLGRRQRLPARPGERAMVCRAVVLASEGSTGEKTEKPKQMHGPQKKNARN